MQRPIHKCLHCNRERNAKKDKISAPFLPSPNTIECEGEDHGGHNVDNRIGAWRYEPTLREMCQHHHNAPRFHRDGEYTKKKEDIDEYSISRGLFHANTIESCFKARLTELVLVGQHYDD